jgi:RNA polymerase sigma factor for flagellar operon FliA
MKHDHSVFTASPATAPHASAARAYGGGDEGERIRRFLPMVRRLAWHVKGSGRDGIELEDLMQAGLVALTECARNHTGPGEDGFAAYAKLRVRGAMIDLMRRSMPQSRGSAEKRRMIRNADAALQVELGRTPTEAELATALHLTPGELATLRTSSAPLHFEALDDSYNESNLAFADPAPDSLTLLEMQESRERLAASVAGLPERLQLVVQLYFVEELNLAEIAAVLAVSIHQLKDQALEKMRTTLTD